MVIRAATEADLDVLASIERASLSGTWTREAFADELHKSFARVWVATRDERVCAFVHCWLIADEIQILNVATAPAFRRQGIARALLSSLLGSLSAQGFCAALLEVRASNEPAIALYRSLGFKEDAIRERYYSDGEAALLMSKRW
jgi:ribosomal-protein-alanine N-acetyltransferase